MKHCSVSKAQMISSHSNQKFIILNLMKQSHFCCNTCFGNMNLFEHDWYITKFPICINVILPVRNTKSDPNQGNFAPERISGHVRRHFWHLDIKGAGNHMSKTAPPTPQHNTELSSTKHQWQSGWGTLRLVNKTKLVLPSGVPTQNVQALNVTAVKSRLAIGTPGILKNKVNLMPHFDQPLDNRYLVYGNSKA